MTVDGHFGAELVEPTEGIDAERGTVAEGDFMPVYGA